jgi:hypothetical protein
VRERVEFPIEDDGEVRLRPLLRSIRRLFGIVQRSDRPAPTLNEIEDEIGAYLAADDERIQRGEG